VSVKQTIRCAFTTIINNLQQISKPDLLFRTLPHSNNNPFLKSPHNHETPHHPHRRPVTTILLLLALLAQALTSLLPVPNSKPSTLHLTQRARNSSPHPPPPPPSDTNPCLSTDIISIGGNTPILDLEAGECSCSSSGGACEVVNLVGRRTGVCS
jgi:hypothetical protein